ncbi:hypothetical protein PR202_gb01511 [Eleusine coracana subsp. coracana]|uniref:SelT-like protein n=1 Tax=Eleusine coracana subsp. coracana TaxID=191504 RepID=A0AAV5DVT9_ELECO|nr:hypothetical protein PR202_gb01511 [Eleusine coracana subsp. coracana]
MDRAQLLLVGLPALLFISDLTHIFAPPPPYLRHPLTTPGITTRSRTRRTTIPTAPPATPPPSPAASPPSGSCGGCHPGESHVLMGLDTAPPSSCNSAPPARTGEPARPVYRGSGTGGCLLNWFRGTAMTMKRMLETSFPGIHVVLQNYPPPFPKRVLAKAVPILQVGAIATIMAGDQIFPRLGMVPPPWYYSLRANRFGTMVTIWLFGNFAQSFLQSSGAFEVHCNGDLVFSKLTEQRFPSEFELRDLIASRLPKSMFGKI